METKIGAAPLNCLVLVTINMMLMLLLRSVTVQGAHDPQFKKSIPCDQLSNGNYVWGCSRYYAMCANKREYVMNCYDNLVLNPDNNQCDVPANVWACQNPQSGAIYRARDPFTCKGKKDGNYAAEQCIDSYYVCIGGQRQLAPCPAGTVFDGTSGFCDYPQNCHASAAQDHVQPIQFNDKQNKKSNTPDNNGNAGSKTPTPIVAAPIARRRMPAYRHQMQFRNLRRNSLGPTYLVQSLPESVPAQPSASLADTFMVQDGAAPAGHNQQQFETAQYGAAPAGYNQQQFETVFAGVQSPEDSSMAALSEFDCSEKPDGVYVIGVNGCASSFWKCSNGFSFEYECPAGLHYDETLNQCVQREFIVACGDTPPTTITTTDPPPPPPPPQPANEVGFDCTGKKDGFYEIQACSNDYFVCHGGNTWKQNCATGLVFDKITSSCDYEDLCGQDKPTSPPQNAHGIDYFNQQQQPNDPEQQQQQPNAQQDSPKQQFNQDQGRLAPQQQQFSPRQQPNGPQQQKQPSNAQQDQPQIKPSQQQQQNKPLQSQTPLPFPPISTTIAASIPSTSMKASFNCSGRPDGHKSEKLCPQGTLFDPLLANCQYAAVCGKSTTIKTPTMKTVAPTFATTPKADFNCSGKMDGYHVKKPCTSVFYSCASGYTIQFECPPTLVFDPNTKICEYPNICGSTLTTTASLSADNDDVLPESGAPMQNANGVPEEQRVQESPQKPPAGNKSNLKSKPTSPNGIRTKAAAITTTTSAPSFDCSSKPNGFYAVQFCESTYVACVAGKATHSACQSGLVFNGQFCDYPANCQAQKSTSTMSAAVIGMSSTAYSKALSNNTPAAAAATAVHPPASPPATVPPPPAGSEPDASVKSDVQPVVTTTAITPLSSRSNFTCKGKPDGKYIRGNCKPQFIDCNQGHMLRMNCPASLVYDMTTNACEYPSACGKPKANPIHIPLQTTITPISTMPPKAAEFSCEGKEGQFPLGSCQKIYIVCSHGIGHLSSCPGALVFDENVQRCETTNTCGKNRNNDEETSAIRGDAGDKSPPATTPPAEDEKACGQIPVGAHAISPCSRNYIVCVKGQIEFRSCNHASLVFNQHSGYCESLAKVASCLSPAATAPARDGASTNTTPTTTAAAKSGTDAGTPVVDDAAAIVTTATAAVVVNAYEQPQINQRALKRRSGYF